MTQENPTVKKPPSEPRTADTQIGTVLRDLSRITRRLPRTEGMTARPEHGDSATRAQVALLIMALGDTAHPQHGPAVDELTRIGTPAVPALIDTLNHTPSWLVAYRAAEALGQIGDGRACNALLNTLRHPNSNVRWSAVRALAQIGDARSLLALRRVAREDRGKTSWGEPVAGAAQSALEQMQSQSMLVHGVELVKTALACVLMIVALIMAFSSVGELRQTWAAITAEVSRPPEVTRRVVPTAATLVEPTVAPTAAPTPVPTPLPTLVATVRGGANVREGPDEDSADIGDVIAGDEIIVTGVSEDRLWYQMRLSDTPLSGSRINGDEGWVFNALVDLPEGADSLPVITP